MQAGSSPLLSPGGHPALSVHTPFLLASSLGSLWGCCTGGAAVNGATGQAVDGLQDPFLPPTSGYLAPFLPFLGLGVLLPTPSLSAQGSPR